MTGHGEEGRSSFERRAWAEAFRALSAADSASPLAVVDLDRLAVSAYLIGRLDDAIAAWEAGHERVRRPRVEHVQDATDAMSRLARLPGAIRDVTAPWFGPRAYRQAYAPLRAPW